MDTPSEHLKGSSGLPLSLFETVNGNREGRSYSGARCALGKTRQEAADFLVFLKENNISMLGGFCIFFNQIG